jgi:HEPN domain-containing protein
MTVQENIKSLIDEAEKDLGASDALAKAGYYAHSLFFAHLILEKFCKAVWMKHKDSVNYPYTHNLIRLIKETNISITDTQVQFYSDMNLFQSKGRYPDTLHAIEQTITANTYNKFKAQLKTEVEWLTKQLQ